MNRTQDYYTDERFLANLSHELRSPLHAMMGWIYLLKRSPHDPKVVECGINAVERSAHALNRIVSNMLELYRLDTGTIEFKSQESSVQKLLEEATDSVVAEARLKDVTLQTRISDTDSLIEVDPEKTKQALINLLAYVIATSSVGETVSISYNLSHGHHLISVCCFNESSGEPGVLGLNCDPSGDTLVSNKEKSCSPELALAEELVKLQGGKFSISCAAATQRKTYLIAFPCKLVAEKTELDKSTA